MLPLMLLHHNQTGNPYGSILSISVIMQNLIKIQPRVYLANNVISAVGRFGLIIPPYTMYGVYCFQVVRDPVFVSAQYLKNELMECIRLENGI